MNVWWKYRVTILAILGLLVSAPGMAKDRDHEDALRLQRSGEILPLEKILENARRYHDGKVLEVELEKKRGAYIYEIKLLDSDGILWEMKLNAVDGKLLSEEEED